MLGSFLTHLKTIETGRLAVLARQGTTASRAVLRDGCRYQRGETSPARVLLGFIGRSHETGISTTQTAAPASQPPRSIAAHCCGGRPFAFWGRREI